MKDNKYTTVQDFLEDKSFCVWATDQSKDTTGKWANWLELNSDKLPLVQQAALIVIGPTFEFREPAVAPELVTGELEKLKARIKQQPANLKSTSIKTSRKPLRLVAFSSLRIAASIAVIAVVSFLLWQFAANPMVEHQTQYGQQTTVVLPDSTLVELNANSKLTYRKRNPRRVWLDGEAYFEVKKKPSTGANFEVITNDLTVEVLGTAFNVIETSTQTEVVLEEGSVRLDLNRSFENEFIMEPGEMVAFSAASTGSVQKQKVATESIVSWKEGVLEFDDVPLPRLMEKIEQIYGWKAEYAREELKHRKISIPLPVNDLNSSLMLLSKAIEMDIERVEGENLLLLR